MSNNKTISNKKGAVALTSLMLAASILAAIAFQPGIASAQEIERKERIDRTIDRVDETREHRLGFHGVKGAGVATDQESGENYRSGFRFLLQKVNGSETEYEVKRGLIGISIDGERVYYTIVPESWSVVLSDDKLTFRASGKVAQGEETFDVNLNGYFAMHTRIGNLWSIQGTMEGRESQYDLHYVGISHGIRPGSIEELQ
ncbi:MAG TPA: hypothetical protein VGQ03_05420 [Nitrososphaera sp.]|jgi:hypothetical protein|nr:hypothetical protein [Nitrososphaera sp.]